MENWPLARNHLARGATKIVAVSAQAAFTFSEARLERVVLAQVTSKEAAMQPYCLSALESSQ